MVFRKILLMFSATLLLTIATAQKTMNKYEKAWQKIDQLIEEKGLTSSALVEVNKLYAMAKLEKKEAQQIKALVYRISLQQIKEEDAFQKAAEQLEREIASSNGASKALLNSITAKLYADYFNNRRYILYSRTETIDFKKSDPETWSIGDFHKKIGDLYQASLKDEKLLQQTKLDLYDAIINKRNVRHLRPTLFDLLGHRALDYFKNDEREIKKPAFAFEIDQASAFDPASSFISKKFPTKDSSSLQHKALLLYQKLIAFHLNDTKPDALIDVDIDRLEFVHSNAVMSEKEALYEKALSQITQQYQELPAAAQAWYLLASIESNKAETNPEYNGNAKAVELLNKIVAQKENSEGKQNALSLLDQITEKSIGFTIEKVNTINTPFRILVNYRNTDQVVFRLIKVTPAIKASIKKFDSYSDEYWPNILSIQPWKIITQDLPKTNDYRPHSVEVKMDGIPSGEYLLIASLSKEFTLKNNHLAAQGFYSSDIAYLHHNSNYFVVNRETGRPLPKTNVQVWYQYYDNNVHQYLDRKGENILTDNNGFFRIEPPKTPSNSNFKLELTYGEDRLFMDEQLYAYYNNVPTQIDQLTTFLFTDRSIYRPGQILHFKGIMLYRNQQKNDNRIAARQKSTVLLFDANGQKVDSITVTSNEYGSYSGRFTIPQNLLNGNFRIEDGTTHHSVYISVEEYKRPKFAVEIEQPAGTYKVNDTIKVSGNAKAYAGNNIDGATVNYRVVRKTRWQPWYDYSYRGRIWPPYGGEEQEIAHGSTKTDVNGKFEIPFKAIPDASMDKKYQPIFSYEISVDVTDISGETRSGSSFVQVGYQALQLSFQHSAQSPADSFKNLFVRSENLNGIFEKATVKISMHRLLSPNRVFRTRYWQAPDQFIMSREEYYKVFPHDIYKNENEPSHWEKGEKILEYSDTTSENSNFKIPVQKFATGWYVLEATSIDKYGETVKAIQYLELTGKENTNPTAFGNISSTKSVYAPKETASYTIQSNLDSIYLVHHLTRINKDPVRSFVELNKSAKNFSVELTEADLGTTAMDIAFVKHNRFYSDNHYITVPFSHKQLNVQYSTFRNKVLPGALEKWTVKISGDKADKVAAELLTTMYDASLDQFKPHSWSVPYLWGKSAYPQTYRGDLGFRVETADEKEDYRDIDYSYNKQYDVLALFFGDDVPSLLAGRDAGVQRMTLNSSRAPAPRAENSGFLVTKAMSVEGNANADKPFYKSTLTTTKAGRGDRGTDESANEDQTGPKKDGSAGIQIRKNFNETAFFIPDLITDSSGAIEFSFTMPEALTKWKWMSMAHTKELAFGYTEEEIITQKDLMVQANAPRFLREGDQMDFSAKITNLTQKELTGQVELQLIDATTNQPVDGWFRNFFPNQFFTVPAGQSVPASFTIEVPFQYNRPLTYRLIARSDKFSDGEEMMLPVVSNRMLVTETLPLNIRGNGTKQFKFEKLLQSGNSESLSHHALTFEFTSNPTWYAVQALPYLMEYPYDCAEQTFNRVYANALASMIANSSPKLKAIFEKWKTVDTSALLSNLQKNQELKSVLLEETPWVFQANNEAQQKRNIALLFDMVRLSRELESNLAKLQELQTPSGAFAWFKGGPEDRYMTQYIITGIGHLKKLNALPKNKKFDVILQKALPYLDRKMKESYDNLVKQKANLALQQIGHTEIQYLYMRSFFTDKPVNGENLKAYTYYRKQSQQFWVKQSRYMQGMIALSLFRTADLQTANNIIKSLQENAIISEEMGMYWKEFNTGGYYWYQSPIESHALLTEAFTDIKKDNKITDDLKTWLLKQKQTQDWRTTKATADACYALLLSGSNWLDSEPTVNINAGGLVLNSSSGAEAGTGYFKKGIEGAKVNAGMGNINVTVKDPANMNSTAPRWGAAYWQYFEDLDKITPSATPLKLAKKLFVEKNTDLGPVLQPLKEGEALRVGDKVKVRIELRVDRPMEYVHMKDMRAASFEPVNVISQYKWQGGLGYYESTKDASTNFFFGYLPRGTWIFEYPMFVTHAGTYSNGITSIQCMYAPEFSAHSEGVKVRVE